MIGQHFARGRQSQPARQPFEEWRADFLLELEQVAIDGRGSDVQAGGRLPDRTGSRDLVEIA